MRRLIDWILDHFPFMIAIGAAATAALTAAASFNPADKLPSVILGVLAAIAAFLAIKHYRLWKDTVDIRKRLDILTTEKDFRSSGIVNVHYEFPTEEIKRAFRASRRNVRILETWCPGHQVFASSIREALKNNCSIELLFLEPECPQADARNEDLGRTDKGGVKKEIDTSISGLYHEFKEYFGTEADSKVQIRLYKGTPTMAVYASDEHFFLAFYPRKNDSAKSPHLEIQGRETWFGAMLSKHFESIWSSAPSYKPPAVGA